MDDFYSSQTYLWFCPYEPVPIPDALMEISHHNIIREIQYLLHHIHINHNIAKFIETTRLRIVRKTNTIYIVQFHQSKVLYHYIFCNVMSRLRVCFMNIYSFKLDWLTIY